MSSGPKTISVSLWEEIQRIEREQPVNQWETASETASKHERIMKLLHDAHKVEP